MNLTEALVRYRQMVKQEGREAADKWLYNHWEEAAGLRYLSNLDLIAQSVDADGEFVDSKGAKIDLSNEREECSECSATAVICAKCEVYR